jgi:hypothetical protein
MASSSVICTCGGWKTLGHAAWLGAHIVNFADDLVILCHGTAEKALQTMREMMERLKLTVNENKTHLCKVPWALLLTEDGSQLYWYAAGAEEHR